MKLLIKILSLFLIFSNASAGVFVDRIDLFQWDGPSKTSYYDCAVGFWSFTANVNRFDNDGNYLYVVCDDQESTVIEGWEVPLYQYQGVSYEEIGIGGSSPYVELHGCFVTYFIAGGSPLEPDTKMTVECPGSTRHKDEDHE